MRTSDLNLNGYPELNHHFYLMAACSCAQCSRKRCCLLINIYISEIWWSTFLYVYLQLKLLFVVIFFNLFFMFSTGKFSCQIFTFLNSLWRQLHHREILPLSVNFGMSVDGRNNNQTIKKIHAIKDYVFFFLLKMRRKILETSIWKRTPRGQNTASWPLKVFDDMQF